MPRAKVCARCRLYAVLFVRGAMRARGAMGPIVIAAVFWPRMTYVGALWIATFPTMALALAGEFRRVAAAASDDGRLRLQPRDPPGPELQRQPVQPMPVRAR